ncbi:MULTISPECIES: recombination mediator RecR [Bombella]|uniref:Recombination protein RecR n=2 Tax=Bombella TaxID=1654741 RepID=A0ABT3WLR6_9PROT|nr:MULTISPECIES: recombination mediator RecR [Bombella]MCT6839404.1 recombination mediator RecR [Bifidobacteriales bacterium]MCT6855037.1 recombination mediator RecR [Bombella apis]MUG05280.1 recombination protein RecR [Bombella sp. ESL0378]MUG90827.1 recombination protein RecR [Bombella sp. ESL0385]PHI96447.1 recombination protein RecR [Parasaccharibacter apium]
MRISPEIDALITRLARLPGLGPRSARRAALALLQAPETRLQPLMGAMQQAAQTIQTCPECGNLDSCSPCSLCADPQRDGSVICVVESVGDLWALERAGMHRGRYQVLGGVLSALSGCGPEDLNLEGLMKHVEQGAVKEVILALGATVEGATTAHWLQEKLAPYPVIVSRLGHGVPMGGALDVLDEGTLAAAMSSRKAL